MIPLINMQLGEIIVGGVGAGLYGMLLFVVLTVFIAGLMVGRTPEYVGKKIEAREVKMAMLAILILPLMILGWTAVAVVYPPAAASMANAGPHGFTEVLYAYTSQTGNNGSAFAGLTGNTLFYNLTGAVAMLVGRFWVIVPTMAIAGSLAGKTHRRGLERHVPDHRPAVRRPSRRRHPHRRRADLLPRARARSHRRASRDARPTPCSEPVTGARNGNLETAQTHASDDLARSRDRHSGDRPGVPQARSAHAGEEPGDVRAGDRHDPDDRPADPRHRHRRSRHRVRSSDRDLALVHGAVRQSSPRLWPKGAARRRPTRCAGRARRRAPSAC